jgi:hypothetical protein
MTDPLAPQDDGGTELSGEEKEGLIPSYITLRRELNEAEQANNLAGQEWGFSRQHNVLNETFLKNLHKRMYGNVWKWAGHYRSTGKNIGVDAYRIPTELRQLLEDCRYWIENRTYGRDDAKSRQARYRAAAWVCTVLNRTKNQIEVSAKNNRSTWTVDLSSTVFQMEATWKRGLPQGGRPHNALVERSVPSQQNRLSV